MVSGARSVHRSSVRFRRRPASLGRGGGRGATGCRSARAPGMTGQVLAGLRISGAEGHLDFRVAENCVTRARGSPGIEGHPGLRVTQAWRVRGRGLPRLRAPGAGGVKPGMMVSGARVTQA